MENQKFSILLKFFSAGDSIVYAGGLFLNKVYGRLLFHLIFLAILLAEISTGNNDMGENIQELSLVGTLESIVGTLNEMLGYIETLIYGEPLTAWERLYVAICVGSILYGIKNLLMPPKDHVNNLWRPLDNTGSGNIVDKLEHMLNSEIKAQVYDIILHSTTATTAVTAVIGAGTVAAVTVAAQHSIFQELICQHLHNLSKINPNFLILDPVDKFLNFLHIYMNHPECPTAFIKDINQLYEYSQALIPEIANNFNIPPAFLAFAVDADIFTDFCKSVNQFYKMRTSTFKVISGMYHYAYQRPLK